VAVAGLMVVVVSGELAGNTAVHFVMHCHSE
jgi:hypothetical protein